MIILTQAMINETNAFRVELKAFLAIETIPEYKTLWQTIDSKLDAYLKDCKPFSKDLFTLPTSNKAFIRSIVLSRPKSCELCNDIDQAYNDISLYNRIFNSTNYTKLKDFCCKSKVLIGELEASISQIVQYISLNTSVGYLITRNEFSQETGGTSLFSAVNNRISNSEDTILLMIDRFLSPSAETIDIDIYAAVINDLNKLIDHRAKTPDFNPQFLEQVTRDKASILKCHPELEQESIKVGQYFQS